MEKFKNILYLILGFAVLLAIPAAIYFIGAKFFHFLSQIDKAVAAAIVAASGTAFAAVFTVVIGQSINKRREIEDAHRIHKIKLYSEFVDFTIGWVFKMAKDNATRDESAIQKEIEEYFIKFSKELMLWASPGVIKAWSNFRAQAGQVSGVQTLANVDSIYRAMRKDLGNSNFGLDRNSLMLLFVRQEESKP